jgi:hypothetical protein
MNLTNRNKSIIINREATSAAIADAIDEIQFESSEDEGAAEYMDELCDLQERCKDRSVSDAQLLEFAQYIGLVDLLVKEKSV